MPIWTYLPSLISSSFRISVYIFLRVIPTSLAKRILPTLYLLYLSSLLLLDSRPPVIQELNSEKNRNVKKNKSIPVLVLSLPTTSWRLRASNIFINTVLLIAAADLIMTPFYDPAHDVIFTRIGAVYPDAVKITARYKEANSTEPTTLRVLYRDILDVNVTDWKDGPLLTFKPDEDWVDTVKMGGLWPNTSYEYILAAQNRTPLHYPSSPLRFRTFPDPRLLSGTRLKFLVSSCTTTNFPYRGPMHRRSIRGFDLLADYLFPPTDQAVGSEASSLSQHNTAEFLLFLGDFIYADVPVYIGDDQEAYRRLYRRNYNSNSFRRIYERLPIFHAYDDHEFKNNFGAGGNDDTPPYVNASNAFQIYNSNANFDPVNPREHYYDFNYGDTAFFVMDTRRYRAAPGSFNRTMLGDVQMTSLKRWLARVNTTSVFKFVVTSVPFTSLWGHDAQSDSWAGFPEEKQALLQVFHSVPNVILLSGDRHEFAAIEFSGPQPNDYPIWEFSTSPLSMFYIPFFRTLRMQSDAFVRKNRTSLVSTENGTQTISHVEDIPLERVIKYIPKGNVKWSAIEVDTRDAEIPRLLLEVLVDGKAVFNFQIQGVPVTKPQSDALETFIRGGIKGLISKLGMKPSAWF